MPRGAALTALLCFLDYDDISNQIDFIICLGGDGTLLYASSLFQVRPRGPAPRSRHAQALTGTRGRFSESRGYVAVQQLTGHVGCPL